MKGVRFFVMISFSDENVLIDFISLVNKYIGTYDYFTQNIKINYGAYDNPAGGRYANIRVFSFKKIYSYDKLYSLLKKTEKIQKKIFERGFSHYSIMCGCVLPEQIISIQKKGNPWSIMIKKNLCAQIQMVFVKGRSVPVQNCFNEYTIADVKSFFLDLNRIYREKTGT